REQRCVAVVIGREHLVARASERAPYPRGATERIEHAPHALERADAREQVRQEQPLGPEVLDHVRGLWTGTRRRARRSRNAFDDLVPPAWLAWTSTSHVGVTRWAGLERSALEMLRVEAEVGFHEARHEEVAVVVAFVDRELERLTGLRARGLE